jgi:hypothetical protein
MRRVLVAGDQPGGRIPGSIADLGGDRLVAAGRGVAGPSPPMELAGRFPAAEAIEVVRGHDRASGIEPMGLVESWTSPRNTTTISFNYTRTLPVDLVVRNHARLS